MDLYHCSKYNLLSFENKEKKAEPTYKKFGQLTDDVWHHLFFLSVCFYANLGTVSLCTIQWMEESRGLVKSCEAPICVPYIFLFYEFRTCTCFVKSEIPILEDISKVFASRNYIEGEFYIYHSSRHSLAAQGMQKYCTRDLYLFSSKPRWDKMYLKSKLMHLPVQKSCTLHLRSICTMTLGYQKYSFEDKTSALECTKLLHMSMWKCCTWCLLIFEITTLSKYCDWNQNWRTYVDKNANACNDFTFSKYCTWS